MALALLGFLPDKVDLVVSGINPVANIGHDMPYSGTVTAAMGAVIWDVPCVAIPLNAPADHPGELDYAPAANAARQIVASIIKHSLPSGVLLNMNVPYSPTEEIKGFHVTRQGLHMYVTDWTSAPIRVDGPYYWIGGDAPTAIPEYGTDAGALAEGYVSITPLQLDLTAYPAMHSLGKWKLNHA